jgi:hypothetical protein
MRNENDAIEGTGDSEKQTKTISNTADGTNTNKMSHSQRKRQQRWEKERETIKEGKIKNY